MVPDPIWFALVLFAAIAFFMMLKQPPTPIVEPAVVSSQRGGALKESRSPKVIDKLARWARHGRSLKLCLEEAASIANEGDHAEVSSQFVVFVDLLTITAAIAGPDDRIRLTDAERIKSFCEKAGLWELASRSVEDFQLILSEHDSSGRIKSLFLLSTANSRQILYIRRLLLSFSEEVATWPVQSRGTRARAHKQICGRLTTADRATFEVDEDAQKHFQEMQAQLESRLAAMRAECHQLLGVPKGCSSDQLRSAYKNKVAQWHPDKLQGMAPELVKFANDELAKINLAYERLSQRTDDTTTSAT